MQLNTIGQVLEILILFHDSIPHHKLDHRDLVILPPTAVAVRRCGQGTPLVHVREELPLLSLSPQHRTAIDTVRYFRGETVIQISWDHRSTITMLKAATAA